MMKPTFHIRLNIVFVLLFTHTLCAQETLNLPLGSSGKIPTAFTTTSESKAKAQMKNIPTEVQEVKRNTAEDFYLETNFGLDQLLRSGMITYQDEISIYVNEIVDILLQDAPQLRDEIQFFTVFSPFPNAFATQRGGIFLNLGLISRLENEAQLAFILCHEISHYTKKHSLNKYVEYREEMWDSRSYRKATSQERLAIRNNYSQRQEIEADSLGYLLFSKSPYGGESISRVFDILKHAEEPLGVTDFELSWLSTDYSRLSGLDSLLNKYIEDQETALLEVPTAPAPGEVVNRRNTSDEDETHGTHPKPDLRKAFLIAWMKNLEPRGESDFVLSSERFFKIRRLARLESCHSLNYQGKFADALQLAHWLSESGENDAYLEKQKLLALYGIGKSRLQSILVKMRQEVVAKQKEQLVWVTSLNKVKYSDIATFCFSYLYETYRKDSVEYIWMKPYMCNFLEKMEDALDSRAFSSKSLGAMKNHYLADSAFSDLSRIAESRYEKLKKWEDFLDSNEGKDWYETWKEKSWNGGYSLGIDSLVVFSPEFFRIRIKKKSQEMKWVDSERKQLDFSSRMPTLTDRAGIYTELIDPHQFAQNTSAESYNDAIQIQRWIDELLMFDDEDFVPSNQTEVEAIFRKKGIRYFATPGAYSVREPRAGNNPVINITALGAPPLWTYALFLNFKPEETGFIYLLLFDVYNPSLYFRFIESPDYRINAVTAAHFIQFMLTQISSSN